MEEKLFNLLTDMASDIKEMKGDISTMKGNIASIQEEQKEVKVNITNMQKELEKVKKGQNAMRKVVNSLKSSQSVIVNNLLFVRDIQEKMQGDLSITKENVTKILEAQNEKSDVLKLKLVK